MQTSLVIKNLSKHIKIECMVSTGGTLVREDFYRLSQTVHVIVATPGRILDLASKKVANLDDCNLLVLDEVDKLLSMDFKVNIENILSVMKPDRQIMMYSATYPVQIKEFLDAHVPDPTFIRLSDEFTLKGLTQYYAYLEEREKLHCLNTLFSKLDISQAIIFCNTAKRVELLAKKID